KTAAAASLGCPFPVSQRNIPYLSAKKPDRVQLNLAAQQVTSIDEERKQVFYDGKRYSNS
ncbi:Hypothetical predicted protein, partial [Podarcis lilfordi]